MKIAFRNAETRQMELVSCEAQVEPPPPRSPFGAFIVDAGRRFPVHESVKTARDRIERRQIHLRQNAILE
jgi:hypothetical protein